MNTKDKLKPGQTLKVKGDRGSGLFPITVVKRMYQMEKEQFELTGNLEQIYLVKSTTGEYLYITDISGEWEIDIYLT